MNGLATRIKIPTPLILLGAAALRRGEPADPFSAQWPQLTRPDPPRLSCGGRDVPWGHCRGAPTCSATHTEGNFIKITES